MSLNCVYSEITECKGQGKMRYVVVKIWEQGHKGSKVDNSTKLITEQRWMELPKTTDMVAEQPAHRYYSVRRIKITSDSFPFGASLFSALTNRRLSRDKQTSWFLNGESAAHMRHLLVKNRTCNGCCSTALLTCSALVSESLPSSRISSVHCRTWFYFSTTFQDLRCDWSRTIHLEN